MIDLYGMGSPNVHKITLALEELALPYTIHFVNVFAGEQYRPDFLAISPNNKAPVIVDSEGPGGAPFAVFESGAILLYLADKTGQLLPAEPAARSVALQWLMVQVSTVGPMFGQLVHFHRYAPAGNDYGQARYKSEWWRILGVLETRLTAAPYLGGEAYSIADVATFPWIRTAFAFFPTFLGVDEAGIRARHPALSRWYDTITARPAVERARARLNADVAAKDTQAIKDSGPEGIDLFTGRGKYAKG